VGQMTGRRRPAVDEKHRPVVAMVSDAIYPYFRGGKELRYHELTRRLAARADVHVYTMQWWPGPRTRTDGTVTYHAICPLIPLYSGGHRSLRQPARFALSCLRLLTADFDVLEADQIPFLQLLSLRLITAVRRKRLVATWHEVWSRADWQDYLGRAGHAAWLTERLAMRLPDHIIAASPQTARRLEQILADRVPVTVAPNGIDLDGVRAAYPDADRTDLVVVGRLLAHKRVDLLLEVVAWLHAAGRPVTCRVIGDGPERAALHAQAQQLGIAGAVDFRPDIAEQKEVYALVKAATAAVFPTAREGFGIAVLEALACGLPVVTTSAPDNLARHLAARSARSIVCEPTAEALAAAVIQVLDQAAARPRDKAGTDTSDEPEPWLADYSWDAATSQVAAAFELAD
jgi:glycosyltransferase involved in cell wall biosynthesis